MTLNTSRLLFRCERFINFIDSHPHSLTKSFWIWSYLLQFSTIIFTFLRLVSSLGRILRLKIWALFLRVISTKLQIAQIRSRAEHQSISAFIIPQLTVFFANTRDQISSYISITNRTVCIPRNLKARIIYESRVLDLSQLCFYLISMVDSATCIGTVFKAIAEFAFFVQRRLSFEHQVFRLVAVKAVFFYIWVVLGRNEERESQENPIHYSI